MTVCKVLLLHPLPQTLWIGPLLWWWQTHSLKSKPSVIKITKINQNKNCSSVRILFLRYELFQWPFHRHKFFYSTISGLLWICPEISFLKSTIVDGSVFWWLKTQISDWGSKSGCANRKACMSLMSLLLFIIHDISNRIFFFLNILSVYELSVDYPTTRKGWASAEFSWRFEFW